MTQPTAIKIAATVLLGTVTDYTLAAIESIRPWVDEVCLINTGMDDLCAAVWASAGADKLSTWSFPWTGDFGAARNAALKIAEKVGATWALTLDADEQLYFPGFSNQAHLKAHLGNEIVVWMVRSSEGSYVKERFLRLGANLSWNGRVHEGLAGYAGDQYRILLGCQFAELPKSPSDLELKLRRDLQVLLDDVDRFPNQARGWFYLGQTYEGLDQPNAAITAYRRCASLDTSPDEAGWACYCAARCLTTLMAYRQAEEVCSWGMTRKPDMAEFPWLAGWCCYQRGNYRDAVTWCQLAIALSTNLHAFGNALFRYRPAWQEGPFDILRYAYRHLNQPVAAEKAQQRYQELITHPRDSHGL